MVRDMEQEHLRLKITECLTHENVLVLKSSNKVDLKSIRKGRTI